MPSRILVQALVLIVGVVYLVFFAVQHQPLGDVLHPLGAAMSVALLLVLAFEHFLWRLPGVGWLTGTPNLRGTWRGRLASDWINPDTGTDEAADREAYLVIDQTHWTIGARLITVESSSRPVTAVLDRADGAPWLLAIYLNEPRQSLRKQSPMHYGVVKLRIAERPIPRLEGNYWTDRQTTGELVFERRNRRRVADFTSAQRLEWDASLPKLTEGENIKRSTDSEQDASGESPSRRPL